MDEARGSGDGALIIRVGPGPAVALPGRRSTSVKGGTYTCFPKPSQRARILAHPHVSLARDEEFPELAKHGLTLDDAASRSDEDLMSLDGIGVATLKKIRARQGNSEG